MFSQFKDIQNAVSLHLVEISPKLSEIQLAKLQGGSVGQSAGVAQAPSPAQEGHQRHCVSRHGTPVFWYTDLKDVPKEFSIFIAHEFFDALPIHKFQVSYRHVDHISKGIYFIYLVGDYSTLKGE